MSMTKIKMDPILKELKYIYIFLKFHSYTSMYCLLKYFYCLFRVLNNFFFSSKKNIFFNGKSTQ